MRQWPQANVVQVLVDQATLVRLDRPAAEIVVGNPSIADVSVQSSKLLVVTGKSFGETNLIVMDADGKVVANRQLIVQEPRTGFVTLYRGGARQTLHCAPYCTPPLVIGDTPDTSAPSPIRSRQSSLSANPPPKARSSNSCLLCDSQLRNISADRIESGQEFGFSAGCEIFVLVGGATIEQVERTRLVTGYLESHRINYNSSRL